jgi:hypothetical protein
VSKTARHWSLPDPHNPGPHYPRYCSKIHIAVVHSSTSGFYSFSDRNRWCNFTTSILHPNYLLLLWSSHSYSHKLLFDVNKKSDYSRTDRINLPWLYITCLINPYGCVSNVTVTELMFVLKVKSHCLLQELIKLNYVSRVWIYEALSRVSSGQVPYFVSAGLQSNSRQGNPCVRSSVLTHL